MVAELTGYVEVSGEEPDSYPGVWFVHTSPVTMGRSGFRPTWVLVQDLRNAHLEGQKACREEYY